MEEEFDRMHTATAATTAPADPDDLLTVAQAADCLQLSVSSIRCYIREGRLKAFRIAGQRKMLIPRKALLDLLEPALQASLRIPEAAGTLAPRQPR